MSVLILPNIECSQHNAANACVHDIRTQTPNVVCIICVSAFLYQMLYMGHIVAQIYRAAALLSVEPLIFFACVPIARKDSISLSLLRRGRCCVALRCVALAIRRNQLDGNKETENDDDREHRFFRRGFRCVVGLRLHGIQTAELHACAVQNACFCVCL